MTDVQESTTPLTARTVEGLERRRRDALVRRDHHALRELMAEDCTYVHSTGGVETGGSYVNRLAAGGFGYESIVADEVSIAVHGCTAIVVYRQSAEMMIAGDRHFSTSRCSATWTDWAGGVRLVAFQSTPLPVERIDDEPSRR